MSVSERVSREDWRVQALLFDEVDLGSELLSIEQDRAANKHTGTTLARRTELRDAICVRLVEGVSQRRIAREFGVSRNTLARLAQLLEASGKMEPYKKRMSAKFAEVIEAGTDLLLQKLEDGTVPANVLPVVVGVFADKKALLDNEPTAIIGTQVKAELTVESWEAWLAGLKTVDAQSTGNGGKTLAIKDAVVVDSTQDNTGTGQTTPGTTDGRRSQAGGEGVGTPPDAAGGAPSAHPKF